MRRHSRFLKDITDDGVPRRWWLHPIDHDRGSWRVPIQERDMAHRPSLLAEQTAEEILMH